MLQSLISRVSTLRYTQALTPFLKGRGVNFSQSMPLLVVHELPQRAEAYSCHGARVRPYLWTLGESVSAAAVLEKRKRKVMSALLHHRGQI